MDQFDLNFVISYGKIELEMDSWTRITITIYSSFNAWLEAQNSARKINWRSHFNIFTVDLILVV